jgi:hypothetical protein
MSCEEVNVARSVGQSVRIRPVARAVEDPPGVPDGNHFHALHAFLQETEGHAVDSGTSHSTSLRTLSGAV